MLFTIIIPIYNVEKYVKNCIESVLNQNENNYEIILIDDCSTDGSLDIVEYYEKLPQVRLIKKEMNSGLSDTRNIGMREAQGEYIVFLDSDDYIEEGCLEILKEIIKERPLTQIFYFDYYEHLEGKITKIHPFSCKTNQIYSGKEYLKEELKKSYFCPMACLGIYKRKFLLEQNLFFELGLLHEDELWTPQVNIKASAVCVADYAFYHYIRREQSITSGRDKTPNGLSLISVCKKLDELTASIEDVELRQLMNNHIAMLYMKGMTIGKLYRKEMSKNIDRLYPLKRAWRFKDRIKAILFAVNLRLYNYLNCLVNSRCLL